MYKLLQWNIWNNENIDNIVEELARFDADIVCVQELIIRENDESNLEKLKSIYPFVYFEIADAFHDGKIQGNAILSKYEIVDKKARFVQLPSSEINDYSREGRIYLEADVNFGGKILHIGTTHLSYTNAFVETPQKDLEVNTLLGYLKMHEDNFIFTGDLNAESTSKYVKAIKKHLKYFETGCTWTTKEFSYKGFHASTLSYTIDHVFASKDINIISAETMDTSYSDHLPILVIFKM